MLFRSWTDQSACLLEVQAVSVRRSRTEILRDISFCVKNGVTAGVIGPNGAGKTTLLEAISGGLPCSSGTIRWQGVPLDDRIRRERLFFLPDGIRPAPDHRVADVLDLFRLAYRQPGDYARALVAALGLEPVLTKRVRHLSKGFSKRFLLSLGMLADVPLLILDEPLDGLDLHQVAVVKGLLARLHDRGRTLLLSIHELSLAEQFCDTFILLNQGRLIAEGSLVELRRRAGLHSGGLDRVFLALT